MPARLTAKKHISAKGLISSIREVFSKVQEKLPPKKRGRETSISLADCLMSGFALFKLKFPSLLQFEEVRHKDKTLQANIHSLFHVSKVPSDTQMRKRLDEVDPRAIRKAFTTVFAHFQRSKGLERYQYLDGKYLINIDGTKLFSSNKVSCQNCCQKHHRNGTVTYYHHMVSAVIAHPDYKEVLPVCPEPIVKEDGDQKNDCERNASERLLRDLRREHPHLPLIVVEDALASNGPHIQLLKELDMNFILGVKPTGNKYLFELVKDIKCSEHTFVDSKGHTHRIRWQHDIPINDSYPDLLVTFIEYWEYGAKGTQAYHNTWITEYKVTKDNAYTIVRGGRNRWSIENETFNTLKNQDYNFEHNYGHGEKNLCSVFGLLLMLAFLVDQIEQASCGLFQAAWTIMKRKIRLWERIRTLFCLLEFDSFSDLYTCIADNPRLVIAFDTS